MAKAFLTAKRIKDSVEDDVADVGWDDPGTLEWIGRCSALIPSQVSAFAGFNWITRFKAARSTSRNMRILSSVACLLPFIIWVLSWAQTNDIGGSK